MCYNNVMQHAMRETYHLFHILYNPRPNQTLCNPVDCFFDAHVASFGVNMAGFEDFHLFISVLNVSQLNHLKERKNIFMWTLIHNCSSLHMHCHQKGGCHGHKVVCGKNCADTNRTVSGFSEKQVDHGSPFYLLNLVRAQNDPGIYLSIGKILDSMFTLTSRNLLDC